MSRVIGCALFLLLSSPLAAQPPAPGAAQEQALKAAAARVAPCVVQIDTTGGTELLDQETLLRRGTGPTTGLVVSADGYVISSAFNFADKPAAVFVAVPGRPTRLPAKVVATDHTRMLTLLKVEATGLPVPEPAPKGEVRVGQWAVALGRAVGGVEGPPSVSVGVVSATGRIHGKAIQTDAKVSPVNYGGALVDVRGRVLGVLVPAKPGAETETAGVEWYDSGIGFAVPLEDVLAVLPRLKQGKDLNSGKLGISAKDNKTYAEPLTVGVVRPGSAAAQAGLQPGDVILEIDGKPVTMLAQLQQVLGPKYEGDTVSVKYRRGKEEVSKSGLKLLGAQTATATAFLGVVPVRDEAGPGVGVRFVFPNSPAAAAGVKPGDRIMRVGSPQAPSLRAVANRDQLLTMLGSAAPGIELKMDVRRKDGKTDTVTVKLAAVSDDVPETLPEPASAGQAGAAKPMDEPDDANEAAPPAAPAPKPDKKPPTGMQTRKEAVSGGDYWLYVPENYDPKYSYALVVWLHAAGRGGKDADDLVKVWKETCGKHRIILVGPKAESDAGWVASEADRVLESVRAVQAEYTIDKQRVVAHGQGVGGQMAFYLGFTAREAVRGVATTGATLATPPKENLSERRLAFFVVAGGKDPLAKQIATAKPQLVERKFPVTFREVKELGREYLDKKTFDELVRWIDSLDRI